MEQRAYGTRCSPVWSARRMTPLPRPAYTTLDTTPLSREKPYLFVDARGKYKVRVPSAHQNTVGSAGATG